MIFPLKHHGETLPVPLVCLMTEGYISILVLLPMIHVLPGPPPETRLVIDQNWRRGRGRPPRRGEVGSTYHGDNLHKIPSVN